LVSFKELDWKSRVQRELSDFIPPPSRLGILSNLLKFKRIQTLDIAKKSSRCRALRIACEFEDSKTWRISNFKGYLKIGGCGYIGIEN